MKKSLAHLPKQKQAELMLITEKICEIIPQAEMIFLFGSECPQEHHLDILGDLAADYCPELAGVMSRLKPHKIADLVGTGHSEEADCLLNNFCSTIWTWLSLRA